MPANRNKAIKILLYYFISLLLTSALPLPYHITRKQLLSLSRNLLSLQLKQPKPKAQASPAAPSRFTSALHAKTASSYSSTQASPLQLQPLHPPSLPRLHQPKSSFLQAELSHPPISTVRSPRHATAPSSPRKSTFPLFSKPQQVALPFLRLSLDSTNRRPAVALPKQLARTPFSRNLPSRLFFTYIAASPIISTPLQQLAEALTPAPSQTFSPLFPQAYLPATTPSRTLPLSVLQGSRKKHPVLS